MGVLISLVAIPLRENVPKFCAAVLLEALELVAGNFLFLVVLPLEPVEWVQVIEISNT